jgi:ribosomal protein S18 acetylase RimI-like enzyme
MNDTRMICPCPAVPDEWMRAGIGLRAEDERDAPFLLDLFVAVRAAEFAALGWPDPVLRQFLASQREFQARHYAAAYPGAFQGIVTETGGPVGRLYLHSCPGDVRVVDIALLPGWRGRGLGGALLGAVQAMAAASGASVSLAVARGNPVQSLYHRLGFVAVGENGPSLEMQWTG